MPEIEEIFRPIEGFENDYQVSNLGRVKSIKFNKERVLKPQTYSNGYHYVNLWKNGTHKNILIHRLVAKTFIENPENKPQVNHINGVKTDNRVVNLEWSTCSENQLHAYKTGLKNRDSVRKMVKGIHKKTGEEIIFPSAYEADRNTGINRANICNVANGKLKTAGGYVWEYIS